MNLNLMLYFKLNYMYKKALMFKKVIIEFVVRLSHRLSLIISQILTLHLFQTYSYPGWVAAKTSKSR